MDGKTTPRRRSATTVLGIGLAAALVMSACVASSGPGGQPSRPASIPQPAAAELKNLSIAPEGTRVDLAVPTFSDSTNVTNPLFPVSAQESVLLLGRVDGKPFRTEVTLLPDTRVIQWHGQQVEALVSQYVAFLGGRIHEVAFDFYAQADDGSVWYLGEDVFNFKDGSIADTHGTWIAGKDGPAAMIMPADPKVGDVYRPENIPGFVFEEVTVKSVGKKLDGPLGAVDGGLVIEELHMDGTTEDKTFAPGYGEFFTGQFSGGGDVEALGLAVPTDALSEPAPAELVALQAGSARVFETVQSKSWNAASATVDKMTAAWESYRSGDVPKMIVSRLTGALEVLARSVDARNRATARQGALDVAQWSLDLQLRHRSPVEIDLARFDLWAAQLLVDAAAGDTSAVNGDFFTLDYIRDRILHSLGGADVTRINLRLEKLQGAVGDEDLAAAARSARALRATLAGVQAASA